MVCSKAVLLQEFFWSYPKIYKVRQVDRTAKPAVLA